MKRAITAEDVKSGLQQLKESYQNKTDEKEDKTQFNDENL